MKPAPLSRRRKRPGSSSVGDDISFWERKRWRASELKELDPSLSTPLSPWHGHTRIQKLRSGEVVALEIEVWPSATLFEAGSSLQLTVQGHDAAKYPAFRHRRLVNRGWHTIFTGGPYDSCLAVPLNRSKAAEIPLAPVRS